MRYWKPRKISGNPKVGVAVAAYVPASDRCGRQLRGLLAAFQAQTHANWQALVVHDGFVTATPDVKTLREVRELDPGRIEVWETAERKQKFGHPHRQQAVERLLAAGCEWIGLTNQDNYYVPVYFEWMVSEAQKHKALVAYCDMVHSHKLWKPFSTRPRRGHIDLGGFLAHRSVVERVRFDKHTFNADGDYVERLVQAARQRTARVPATLFVHN